MRDRAYKLGALGTQAVFPGHWGGAGFAVICSAQVLAFCVTAEETDGLVA